MTTCQALESRTLKESREVANESDEDDEKNVERETFKHVDQHDQLDFDKHESRTLKESRRVAYIENKTCFMMLFDKHSTHCLLA